jgi:hypothetical protein
MAVYCRILLNTKIYDFWPYMYILRQYTASYSIFLYIHLCLPVCTTNFNLQILLTNIAVPVFFCRKGCFISKTKNASSQLCRRHCDSENNFPFQKLDTHKTHPLKECKKLRWIQIVLNETRREFQTFSKYSF